MFYYHSSAGKKIILKMIPMFLCAFVVIAIYSAIYSYNCNTFYNNFYKAYLYSFVLVVNWAYIVIFFVDFQPNFESYNSLSDKF